MDNEPRLGLLIKFIHHAIKKDCDSMLREIDLTFSQFDVLMYLLNNQDKAHNQRDIEKEFMIKNPTVTGILNRLEAKGFIRRAASQDDARYKKIILTEKSRQIEKKVHKNGDRIEERLTQGISPGEKEQLGRLLKIMLKNFS